MRKDNQRNNNQRNNVVVLKPTQQPSYPCTQKNVHVLKQPARKKSVYIASPLFSLAEQAFNRLLSYELIGLGYKVFLPQEFCAKITSAEKIAKKCKLYLSMADFVLVNLDGADADSGTAFEAGIAYNMKGAGGTGGFRTDFRITGDDSGTGSNAMFRLLGFVVRYHGSEVNELAALIDSAIN